MSIKILHAADFHLDSAFAALSAEQSRQRRRELRETVERLCDYVNQNGVELVLLAGDLFDGAETYRETVEQLLAALARMHARVFIAPGNHDLYSEKSLYATLDWPENVHIFKSARLERVELPGCAVYGAAFTSSAQEESLLAGFHAPDDGLVHLMVLHGELSAESRYDPIRPADIAASGLDYLALGHTHDHRGVQYAGQTAYAYSGCLEGRGFDELGEKGFLCGTVERGAVELAFVPFALRRYEILRLDVTGQDPTALLREALKRPEDLYRVIFTGETDERGVDCAALAERFAPTVFALELRDETHLAADIWARADEDSLRGIFLRALRARFDAASSDDERAAVEMAVRFGLAALDKRDV